MNWYIESLYVISQKAAKQNFSTKWNRQVFGMVEWAAAAGK